MFADSHCHLQLLDYTKLGCDMPAVVARAGDAGVTDLLCVATDLAQSQELYSIADSFDNVHISVGLHPNEEVTIEPSLDDYLAAAKHPKVVAIGETGLDYYRGAEHAVLQRQRFETQIAVAKQLAKALIIHSRAAKEDTLAVLRDSGAADVGGVLHCFTEDLDMAMRGIELNFYVSFSGIVSFANAKQLQEVALALPLERMLIETDCPFLAPVPVRGTHNEPANVVHVAAFIAKLRGIEVAELAEITRNNYLQLFGITA